jgi:hypothetical protein
MSSDLNSVRAELPDLSARYLLPVDRSDWTELLVDWQPLIPQQSSLWLLTKFGEVFFCQSDGKIGMLQASVFKYQVVAKDKTDFQEWLVDSDEMSDWFVAPLVDRLENLGRHLQPDQCYSFTMPLGLGGALKVENVMTVPVREHFGLWGHVFRQIKDLPDGAQVVFKFK